MSIPNKTFWIFVGFFLAVYGIGHLYLWWRLVHPLKLAGWTVWLARLGAVLLVVSFPIIHFNFRDSHGPVVTAANWLSAVWLGMVLYLVLATFAADLLRLFTWGRVALSPLVVAGVGAAAGVYGLVEARWLRVTELRVPVTKLPANLEGLRIAQLSDVHVGQLVRGRRLEQMVERVNALNPDLIVITGDLVDAEAFHMEDMVEPLRRLRSKHGVFACTGNHEYFAGVDKAEEFMRVAGITLLRNRLVRVAGDLQLVGRDDVIAERITRQRTPPLREILRGADRSLPTVLLYHTPVTTLAELEESGVDLQLSGHTHQGQLWPFRFMVRRIFRTPYGLFTNGRAAIYVSRGTGTWGPPMRVAAPPEITLVTLVSR